MIKEIMIFIAIILISIIAILHFTPRKVILKKSSAIVLQSFFGNYKTISIEKIDSLKYTSEMPNDLIRTMGTKIGKRASGRFYSRKNQENYYLFVTGKCKTVSFVYEGKIFIVDSWTNE